MTERKNTKLYRIPAVAFFYLFGKAEEGKKAKADKKADEAAE